MPASYASSDRPGREPSRQPAAVRPRGTLHDTLDQEGISWEGDVLLIGQGGDIPAWLTVTAERLVLSRGDSVLLETPRSWLVPAPLRVHEQQVRVSITPEGVVPGRTTSERLLLDIQKGRGPAQQLVTILTGRMRKEQLNAELPNWKSGAGAGPSLSPLPSFETAQEAARVRDTSDSETRGSAPIDAWGPDDPEARTTRSRTPMSAPEEAPVEPQSRAARFLVHRNHGPAIPAPANSAEEDDSAAAKVSSIDEERRKRAGWGVWTGRIAMLLIVALVGSWFAHDYLPIEVTERLPAFIDDSNDLAMNTGEETEPSSDVENGDGTLGAGAEPEDIMPTEVALGVGGGTLTTATSESSVPTSMQPTQAPDSESETAPDDTGGTDPGAGEEPEEGTHQGTGGQTDANVPEPETGEDEGADAPATDPGQGEGTGGQTEPEEPGAGEGDGEPSVPEAPEPETGEGEESGDATTDPDQGDGEHEPVDPEVPEPETGEGEDAGDATTDPDQGDGEREPVDPEVSEPETGEEEDVDDPATDPAAGEDESTVDGGVATPDTVDESEQGTDDDESTAGTPELGQQPVLESQAASVSAEQPAVQQFAAEGIRYSIEGATTGSAPEELPEINEVTYGEWVVLSVEGQNWTESEQVFDMRKFGLIADGQEVQLDVGNSWVASLLDYMPAYGNTDATLWAPGERHDFVLTFLVPRNAESLVLRAGDQQFDLRSILDRTPRLNEMSQSDTPEPLEATVVDVIDGETVMIEKDGIQQTVRYLGIDIPGEGDCFASEATEIHRSLVEGRTVKIERQATDVDARGNWVRDVWVELDDGRFALISHQLVESGAATAAISEPNTRFASWLRGAEAIAQAESRGLWSSCQQGSEPMTEGTTLAITVDQRRSA